MSDDKQPDALGSAIASTLASYEAFMDGRASELEAQAAEPMLRTLSQPRRKTLEALGWPRRALDAAERADTTKPAIARIGAWDQRRDDRNVVVLTGATGTGKTVAAAWWALRQRERVTFGRASTFAAASRYDADARARWYEADALCLDDLGAEYMDPKGSLLVDLDELIDTYYADRRPLVISTNLDAAAFKARYGARIEDRIRECAVWARVDGQSLRRAP